MDRIRKAAACMLFLLLLSLTACGMEDKADAFVTEESAIFTEEESIAENTESASRTAEDESAEKDADIINSAATDESHIERKETENIADPSVPDSSDKEKSVSDEITYKSILLGNRNFICMDQGCENKSLNIKEIGQIITDDESVNVSIEKFAVIDLDGDGKEEAVLWIQINGMNDYGFEVLHALNGEIYGHTLAYREFMNLKADGTFMMSGGASDTRIGKMTFSGTEYDIVEEAINSQEEKADVKWYDLSEENINAVF